MPVGIPQFEMNGYDYNSARSFYYPNYDNLYAREDAYRRDSESYRRDDPYRPEDRLESPRRDDLYSNFNPHPVEDYKNYDTRQAGGSEYPSYEVDHLATFSASQSEALKPDVGLSKLAAMANTSGIWTMKCILIIKCDSLVVHEKGTGSELERFAFGALRNPVAISKPNKREVYNNLVLLTVVDGNGRRDAQAHMHIFLAGSEPAQDIVNEIISAKDGRPSHINARIPPPPNQPAPEPPNHVRDKVNSFERNMRDGDRPQEPIGFPPQAIRDQDQDSVLSEKTEKDVQLLNHCFDDIEKFVSRLQKAAESYKELERLRKEKGNKNKKARQEIESKLELTAQPPKPHDYIDIFQKFKLSFNLLAKLKAHIHDPNAPELVHFLFTPLSLIYEASRAPAHGNGELASNVLSPLLTREAKELLLNCLTSKETDLWMSLGETWFTSRDKWKTFVQPYTPRFYNGWHPAPSMDEMTGAQLPPASRTYINTPIRNYEEPPPPPNLEAPRRPIETPITAPYSHPMPPQNSNEYFLEELKKRGAAICTVLHSREKKNVKELTVAKGEYLEVLDDSRNWWKLKNLKGAVGHAPFTILNKIDTINKYDDGIANRKGQRGEMSYF